MASLIRTSSPSFISTTTETPLHKLNNLSSKAMVDKSTESLSDKDGYMSRSPRVNSKWMSELQRILQLSRHV
jgi:hypothetical protein